MWFPATRRFFQIVFVVTRHVIAHCCGHLISRISWLSRWFPNTDMEKPDRLRHILEEELGGSFIKLGQMLSLQPDILPVEYCQALYNLLDHVHPVPYDEIVRVFREETGLTPDDVFDEFDSTSLASGSIGQVHVAWKNGKKYAVKVQRPDTQTNFARDIKLMNGMASIANTFRLSFIQWIIDPLSEFAKWTGQELDFRREAQYLRLLGRNAVGNPNECVPAVLDELSSRRVLVVEFLGGITLMDHIRRRPTDDPAYEHQLDEIGFVPDTFAENIIDNFLGDAFNSGNFHADLHPANLMVLRDNCVGYMDFGIVGQLSVTSRHRLVSMTLAYARHDMDSMFEHFIAVSSCNDDSDPEAFRTGLKKLSESWYKTDHGEAKLQITTTTVMLDMLTLSRRTRILPQRDVVLYIRASIAIDGLVRQFAPDFDVANHLAIACRRYLTSHARKTLLSHDTLLNWSRASTAIMNTGAFRVAGFLERMAREHHGSQRGTIQPTHGEELAAHRRQVFQLTAFVGVLTWLLARTPPPMEFGINLFTAQIVILGYALLLLGQTLMKTRQDTAHV